MTRAESLAYLSGWSRDQFAPVPDPVLSRAARSHGLAAVRAIRAVNVGGCRHLDFSVCIYRREAGRGDDAYKEACLAFRAALDAVGLGKTL